jgi:hypothetical protein
MKTNQGIVSKCCDHEQSSQEDCKENISCNINPKLVDVCCEKCLKHLNSLMETMTKILPLPLDKSSHHQMPLVSINVIDTDNNLNICMCNATEAVENKKDIVESSTVCPKCKNVIKAQSSERCPLISRQTMLGDVLFNRVDSQYLSSTYSTKTNSELKKLIDPYTPESIESHSPQTEMEELSFINTTNESDDILENMRDVIKHKSEIINEESNSDATERHFVTPHQLTTRLEILRRESQLDCISKKSGSGSSTVEDSHVKSSHSSKHCFSCCSSCSIS